MPTADNPYRRPPRPAAPAAAAGLATNNETMGPQSQRRLTLKDRTHLMQSSQPKKKLRAGDQQTLFGGRAFDPNQDCTKCKGKLHGRDIHRAHHPLCWNNRKTKGVVSLTTMESIQEEKRLQQHFATPLADHDKCSGKYLTKKATEAFFTPRQISIQKSQTTTIATTVTMTVDTEMLDFGKAVMAKVNDPSFVNEHKDSRTPLAMLAFAGIVVEKLIRGKNDNIFKYFDGLAMRVPNSKEPPSPQYHSIVGQQLLYVDWKRMFNIEVHCPRCPTGVLIIDRTNFSKNKMLFPTFDIDGPPRWCMVQSMVCSCCRGRCHANSDSVLRQIPGYARSSYPVEPKYALPKNSHIGSRPHSFLIY